MNKSIEATGKTLEAAIKSALDQLGMERDEVSVEVLENPKSGFLGLGATLARIRVSYTVSKADDIREFLCGLLERMGSDAVPQITETEENSFSVEFIGENLGTLIGHRGDTLDAIQHLTNYAVNKDEGPRIRVSIDAENYRKKREESLERLALKVAAKVVKYRKNLTLEPMNAYERHVIHAALQDQEDITTYSTGREPNRRIVVAYSKYKSFPDKAE